MLNYVERKENAMMEQCRGKRTDTKEWVEGWYFEKEGKSYIVNLPETIIQWTYTEEPGVVDFGLRAFEIIPETLCRDTGRVYMNEERAYEGDIFESQSNGLIMVLRYGTWQAYCPADRAYMDCVGFYAEAEGYPQMPIGDLKDYALKIGNIIDNPEVMKQGGKA